MGLSFSHNKELARHILEQLTRACEMISIWNKDVRSADDYLSSPNGMQTMAASCMLLESIGEGVKKLDRLLPGFLLQNSPNVPWRSIKGLRDHIAHGYFNIDSDIVFDVAINEIPGLRNIFINLQEILSEN